MCVARTGEVSEMDVRNVPPGGGEGSHLVMSRNVSKTFVTSDGRRPFLALDQVNLEIKEGEFVCLIGPSGCGKSTFMNMVAGLVLPSTGEMLYRGSAISAVNTSVGYITQHETLLPWRSVERNVGIALEIQGVGRSERKERVAGALAEVGLSRFADRYPSQLSGGMRKRVILARTLVYGPETLLMDEPFGALDAFTRLHLQQQLLSLWESDRKTVLFVTHDLEEALFLADRIVVFDSNPGRIVHVEEVALPRPRDVRELRTDPTAGEMWARLYGLLEKEAGL